MIVDPNSLEHITAELQPLCGICYPTFAHAWVDTDQPSVRYSPLQREKPDEHEREHGLPPVFTRNACDVCGTARPGERHAAHGIGRADDLVHLEVCTSCIHAIQY